MSSIIIWLASVSIGTLLVILLIDSYISSYSKYTFHSAENIENHYVGLVLGTSKYTSHNTVNLFYKYRLDAAVELYKKGVICKVLVSGDNGTHAYNEPRNFYNDLVKNGVDPNDIVLDFAGFRTLDSVVRSKKVFQQDKILIISQQFHNERALFLAHNNNLDAHAFNAKAVKYSFSPKTYIREKLARVKAFLDVYILDTQPKFLGEQITIS